MSTITHAVPRIDVLDELSVGTTVRVHQKIIEGKKSRIQVYEGLIIDKKGKQGINTNIRVRRIGANNVGIERIFPVFSPNIEKIEVTKRASKVRRSNLGYLRHKKGDIKLKESIIKKQVVVKDHLPNTHIDQEADDAKSLQKD